MAKTVCVAILFLCFWFVKCKVVNPADLFNDEHVKSLTSRNFSETLKKHDYILCVFYAPWCPYCLQFDPIYIKSSILAEESPTISKALFARVNCQIEKDICKEYHIPEYPTIRYFKYGKQFLFNGVKTTEGILDFLNKYVFPEPKTELPEPHQNYRDQQL